MKTIKFIKQTVLATLLAMPLLVTAPSFTTPANAYETNPAGYDVPDLAGREPISQGQKKDEISGLPCKYEIFNNMNGKSVIRLGHNGNVFAYIVDEDLDNKADYAIVDSDGDHIFETKYEPGEKWGVPKWAI